MNTETPKIENIEDGVDLYDGMIFKALEDREYFNNLDSFSLGKVKDRLDEYYKIMDDADYTKGEKLTKKLGFFINKYLLKSMLDHVDFLITKENFKLDVVDTAIIFFIDNRGVLNNIDYDDLIPIRKRLMLYYAILESDDEEQKKGLSTRIGHHLASDSVKGMLDYVDGLIEEKEGEMRG